MGLLTQTAGARPHTRRPLERCAKPVGSRGQNAWIYAHVLGEKDSRMDDWSGGRIGRCDLSERQVFPRRTVPERIRWYRKFVDMLITFKLHVHLNSIPRLYVVDRRHPRYGLEGASDFWQNSLHELQGLRAQV